MFIKRLLFFLLIASFGCATDKGGVAGKAYTLFTTVYSGENFSCATLADSRTMCWGGNDSGQLGLGDTDNRGDDFSDFNTERTFINVGSGRTIRQMSGGAQHACAVLDNYTLKCWGQNFYGQLGYGDTEYRGNTTNTIGDSLPAVDLGSGRTAVAVAASRYHTCALLDNGGVKCWGLNNSGQLGKDNLLYLGDSANEMGDNMLAIDLGAGRTATAIGVGPSFTCALLDDATVKCWGGNSYGQLGKGHTLALGDGAGEMAALTAIDLGTGRTATSLSVGGDAACAILDNGALKCWGSGFYGNLGNETFTNLGDGGGEMGDALLAVNLGAGRSVRTVWTRDSRTCAILDNDALKCWGLNSYGALGNGSTATVGQFSGDLGDALAPVELGTGRIARSIAMGTDHTCALLDNGFIKCWGRNLLGQLGLGDTVNRGDTGAEMGDLLPAVNNWNMQH